MNLDIPFSSMTNFTAYQYINPKELVQPNLAKRLVLPIEYFRTHHQELFQGQDQAKTFYSSGTTSEIRASSHFSTAGLTAYRDTALSGFSWLLSQVFPSCGPLARGISLVPHQAIWPHSSLAQMITWLAEVYPVSFIESAPEDLEKALANIHGGAPVWLFGTALHWLALLQAGAAPKLPSNCILIETGGTKGQKQSIHREDFYQKLQQHFQIADTQIVSEYGMCELASQAYDFVLGDGQPRRFRFPPAVKTWATLSDGQPIAEGCGALVVADSSRVDYPWPIRTQDFVQHYSDGSFTLLGRVPNAPLKGCSLLVASDLINASPQASTKQRETLPITSLTMTLAELEALRAALLSSPSLREAWRQEFASDEMAEQILVDLTVCFCAKTLLRAAQEYLTKDLAKRWLCILPENHSLAGFQPLILAKLLGLHCRVRIPGPFRAAHSALNVLLDILDEGEAEKAERLPPEWHIETSSQLHADAILLFGSNETMQSVNALVKVPVQGFGSSMAISVLQETSSTNFGLMLKDAFHLRQRGCMSTRLALIGGQVSADALTTSLEEIFNCESFVRPLPAEQAAIDCESLRYRDLGTPCLARKKPWQPLFPVVELLRFIPGSTGAFRASPFVSQCPFTLPLILLGQESGRQVSKILEQLFQLIPEIRLITTDLPAGISAKIECRPLGAANQPIWDATHQNQRLFMPDFPTNC